MTTITAHLLLVSLCASCITRLPAPPDPPRVDPAVEMPSSQPPPGRGRVVIATERDIPSVVHFVEGASFANGQYGVVGAVHLSRLCVTPCVVDLPYGNHELRFTTDGAPGDDQVYVSVSDRTSALRVALGKRTNGGTAATAGRWLVGVGGLAALTGGLLWPVDDDAGVIRTTALGGVAALALGLVLSQLDRPIVQPASSIQWTLGE